MHRKIHITYNAPVTLTFILICGAVTLLGYLTGGRSTASLFAVYGLQLNDPLTYLRLFTHEQENFAVRGRLNSAGVHNIKFASAPLALGIEPVARDAGGVLNNA